MVRHPPPRPSPRSSAPQAGRAPPQPPSAPRPQPPARALNDRQPRAPVPSRHPADPCAHPPAPGLRPRAGAGAPNHPPVPGLKPRAGGCARAALAAALLVGLAAPAAALPGFRQVHLELRAEGGFGQPDNGQRLSIPVPAGWTGELDPDQRTLRLFGPTGEGELIVSAAYNPNQLTPIFDELQRNHRGAAPTHPQEVQLPGVARASRFAISGRERGEMMMMKIQGVWLLFVAVVEAEAWPRLRRQLRQSYRRVKLSPLPPSPAPPAAAPPPAAVQWAR